VDVVDIPGDRITISGNYAYIAGIAGLYIMDIINPLGASLTSTLWLPAPGFDVFFDNNNS